MLKKETLWQGDSIELPFSFNLTPNKPFTLRVDLPDCLEGRLFWRKSVLAYVGNGGDWNNPALKENAADILWKELPEKVPEDGILRLWLRVSAPKDAVEALHFLSIKVECEGQSLSEKLSLNVIALPLPNDGFSLELWQYPYSAARYYGIAEDEIFGERHREKLKKNLRLLKQAGGDILSCTICEDPWNSQTFDPYPSMVKWTRHVDGSFSFDYKQFDIWVRLAEDCGVNGAIKCFSLLPWGNRLSFWDERRGKYKKTAPRPGSAKWRRLWGRFLQDFIAHLSENAWFDRCYIALDERPQRVMKHALKLLSQHTNTDGRHLKISCAVNISKPDKKLLSQLDDVSIVQKEVPKKLERLRKIVAERRRRAQLTTLYTCCGDYPNSFSRSAPEESEWTVWYAFAQGADGFLRWALDAWTENPLEDASFRAWESGDTFLIYPEGLESPRFAMLSQGIRNVRKARYILNHAEAESCKVLKDLIEGLQLPKGRLNKNGGMEGSEKSNQMLLDDVYRLRDALSLAALSLKGQVER